MVLDAEEFILKLQKESIDTLNSDQDLSSGPSESYTLTKENVCREVG